MFRVDVKRFLDLLFSAGLFLILIPIAVVVAVILLIEHRSSPFFLQWRIGQNGRNFLMLKFKTMKDAVPGDSVESIADENRLTAFGNWLRSCSLDEIPQLLNVLKGDMSLVGPRPLLPEYLDLYSAEQARRHLVRPGMTGWAQVNGRNRLSWQEKFELDVWYVENRSLRLDFQILLKTIPLVLGRQGISSGTTVTMEKFTGNGMAVESGGRNQAFFSSPGA